MSRDEQPKARGFDLTALRHPAWWIALAVLVVNDRLLKGRGVVPAWLTGKLSDFALVVVAPALFAAILPRGLPWRRVAASVSVLGLFVATELSRTASDAVVALTARLGLYMKLWPDPTDLLALAGLPLTIYLLRLPPRPVRRWSRGALERAGIIFGVLACLADSNAGPGYRAPYFVNVTGAISNVRFTWVLKTISCDSPEQVAANLGPDDLTDPSSLRFEPGEVATLSGIPGPGVSPVGKCGGGTSGTCVGVVLETDGAAPVLVVAQSRWIPTETSDSPCMPKIALPAAPDPDAVALRLVNGALQFTVVANNLNVQITSIDLAAVAARPHDPAACRAISDDFSALIAAPTCQTSSDCLGVPGLVGASPSCNAAINVTAKATFEDLVAKWGQSCATIGSASCGPPHPATCIAGQCVSACPDVTIPVCPASCPAAIDGMPFVEGASCETAKSPNPSDGWCRLGDRGCFCGTRGVVETPIGVVKCFAIGPASPTCPLNSCLETPGGFVDTRRIIGDGGGDPADGGVADAEAADATRNDASPE